MAHDIPWEFWIDVGGTFTDSFARRPDGTLVHWKVLSSGVVKGSVGQGSSRDLLVDLSRRVDPDKFWNGASLRLLDNGGQSIAAAQVARFDAARGQFQLAAPLSA